jgi:hypothetical protein
MKINKLSAAFLALLLALLPRPALAQGTIGPPNPILCNQQATANVASATTTALISGIAGKITIICGWHATSTLGTSSTFAIEYGTQAGGPCATPTAITPAFNVINTAPSADHVDYGQLQIPAGAQVCVITTGASVGLGIVVWFNQL